MRIKFKIDDKSYEVRTPSIRDYYKIRNEMAFNDTPGFYLLSLLSGCEEKVLRTLSVDQYNSLWEQFYKFYNEENSTTPVALPRIVLNGKSYGLIQMDKMTIGEFADLDILLNSDNSESRLHEILAILYRDITIESDQKYVLAPYDLDAQKEREELFLDLPVSFARGILGFFLRSALHSIKVTVDSLEKDPEIQTNLLAQEALKILKEFQEPGSLLWSFLQEEAHSKLTGQVPSQSIQPLTSSSSNTMKPKQQNWLHKKLFKNISAN